MAVWRLVALLWLALAVACAGFVGWRLTEDSPVETDLLALLPATERNPAAEAAVKLLAERLGNRVVFLVGHVDRGVAINQARRFAGNLRNSGAFVRVVDSAPPFDAALFERLYGPHRAALLTPADRAWLADPAFDPKTLLANRLHQPFASGIATDPAVDPFGFFQRWLSALPLAQGKLAIEDGTLSVRENGRTYALILAEPEGNAFNAATQARVVAAVNTAESIVRDETPDLSLLRTGTLFYGEAARSRAEAEVDLIGGGSLVGILALLWLLFRSLRPLLLAMLTVAVGIAWAMAAVLVSQGKIHLLTLVFGASLIGEAVDYSIQYFAAHLEAGQAWQPISGLRRVLPGLAVALATSLVGYGALTLTPFPAISQIALFAFVGLSTAWLSVLIVLPVLVGRPNRNSGVGPLALPARLLAYWRDRVRPRSILWLAVAIVAAAIPGWMLLVADDDIRQLVARPAALSDQEATIRRLVGLSGNGRFFLTEGASAEQALQREEALTARLRGEVGRGIAGFAAVSDFVPSASTQANNRRLLNDTLPPERMAGLLDAQGFRPAASQAWNQALSGPTVPLRLADWQASPLAVALRHQVMPLADGGTALLTSLDGDDGSLDLTRLAADLPGVSLVDKTAGVSALFAQYRRLGGLWLPLAVAIVLAVLVGRYGLRTGAAILVPTGLAMGVSLAVYGYLGVPLTLFTIMGLVLVLGVGANYAIFVVEAGDRAPAPFAGVLLSAATTILSFGLLSLSSMPALHQFGLILLIGVAASVLLAPIALTLGKRPCA